MDDELDVDEPAQPYARALALIEMRRLDGALEELVRLLATRNDDPYAHSLLAWVKLNQDDFAGAIASAQEANGLDPDQGLGHSVLAQAHYRAGVPFAAVEEATRAIAVDPHDAISFAIRGHSLWALGRRDEALADLEEAKRLDPEDVFSRLLQYDCLAQTPEKRQAAEELRAIAAIEPENADFLMRRGNELWAAGKYREAGETYAEALRLDPRRQDLAHARSEAARNQWFVPYGALAPTWIPPLQPAHVAYAGTAALLLLPGILLQIQGVVEADAERRTSGLWAEAIAVFGWAAGTLPHTSRGLADIWLVFVVGKGSLLRPFEVARARCMIWFAAVGIVASIAAACVERFVVGATAAILVAGTYAAYCEVEIPRIETLRRALAALALLQPGLAAFALAGLAAWLDVEPYLSILIYESCWFAVLLAVQWIALVVIKAQAATS